MGRRKSGQGSRRRRAQSDSSDTDGPAVTGPSGLAPAMQKDLPQRRHCKRGARGLPLANEFYTAGAVAAKGWRAPVTIRGQKVRFLVDTGSDVTILPYDRYIAIPAEFRPTLAL